MKLILNTLSVCIMNTTLSIAGGRLVPSSSAIICTTQGCHRLTKRTVTHCSLYLGYSIKSAKNLVENYIRYSVDLEPEAFFRKISATQAECDVEPYGVSAESSMFKVRAATSFMRILSYITQFSLALTL